MIQKHADPRDLPVYTVAEAAHWLGQGPGRLRSWLVGQQDPDKANGKRMQSVIRAASTRPVTLSFWNLVECSVLITIRDDHRVSLQKIRRALAYVSKRLGQRRPLIQQEFLTDGVHLFVDRLGQLVSASESGQTAMRAVLEASLKRIERDEHGLARRLFPWRRTPQEPRTISVDASVSFGRPVVAGTGTPVEVLFERFSAGESIEHLAAEYRLGEDEIEDLLRKWFRAPAA